MWCSDESMCQKMAKFWEEKDHWLHHEGACFPLKEIWDGERFSEVSWFWDPGCGWVLPVRCTVPVKGIAALHARIARALHAHYTQCSRSNHAVSTHLTRKYTKMRVITRM